MIFSQQSLRQLREHMHKLLTGFCFVFWCAKISAAQHHPQAFLDEIRGSEHEGQEIVSHYCSNCHAVHPLINLGAPRINHPEDWIERLKQDPKLLWKHSSEGFHAMPARGGCFECSDEQLKKAIFILTGGNQAPNP